MNNAFTTTPGIFFDDPLPAGNESAARAGIAACPGGC